MGACSDATSDAPSTLPLLQRLSCPMKRSTSWKGKLGVPPCLRVAPSAPEAPALMFYPPRARAFTRTREPNKARGVSRVVWRRAPVSWDRRCQPRMVRVASPSREGSALTWWSSSAELHRRQVSLTLQTTTHEWKRSLHRPPSAAGPSSRIAPLGVGSLPVGSLPRRMNRSW